MQSVSYSVQDVEFGIMYAEIPTCSVAVDSSVFGGQCRKGFHQEDSCVAAILGLLLDGFQRLCLDWSRGVVDFWQRA